MYKQHLHLLSIVIALLVFNACKTVTYLADTEVNYLDTDGYYPADKDVAKMIAPYTEQVSAKMDVVIGYLEEDLVKARPNSNLGNWFTDILLAESQLMFPDKKVDMAFQNYGGLRVPAVKKGELTVGKIYELMPFDNTLVTVEVDGKLIQKFLNHLSARGGWPMSNTVSFTRSGDTATDIMIHNEALDMNRTYVMAIPDYVANGGDSAEFLKPYPQDDSQVYIRDILIKHLKNLKEQGLSFEIDNTKRIH